MAAAHVSSLSIVFMCISLLVCFGAPIGLMIWAKIKYKKEFSFLPLFLGAAAFIVFQIIIRIQILLPLLQSNSGFRVFIQASPWLYAAFLAITAGLFEEPARFLVFSLIKKPKQLPNGLSYGIGHGGAEAILLVGMTFINNIIYSLSINSGSWGTMMAMVPKSLQEQYGAILQALVSYPPEAWLIGGVERAFTLAVQIALSLVVLRGFITGRKWMYLGIATLLHAAVDFVAVSLQILQVNMWIIECAIGVMAALSVLYIVKQAREWRKSIHEAPMEFQAPEERTAEP